MALKKGSTSLFRRSPKTTKSLSYSHKLRPAGDGLRLRKAAIVLGLAVGLTYSCHTFFSPESGETLAKPDQRGAKTGAKAGNSNVRSRQSNSRDDLPAEVKARQKVAAYDAPDIAEGSKRVWRYYLPGGIGRKALIAKLYQGSCYQDAKGRTKLASISLWFRSKAGHHQADYQLRDGRVTIADTTFALTGPLPAGIDSLCKLRKAGDSNSQFPLDQPMVAVAMALIGQTAPACQMSFDRKTGFTCDLSRQTIKGLEQKLGGLQRQIIHHSKRHPYLLVRRIAVALLASRLADPRLPKSRFGSERKNLCNILKYSLPLELPLVLRTPVIKNHVCATKVRRKQLADLIHVAASDAYREIAAVSEVYRSSSRMGKVSLRLKGDHKIGRHLWMELTPLLDGSDAERAPQHVALNTDRPGEPDTEGGQKNGFALATCFHPLYSASSPIYVDFVSRLMPKSETCQQLLTTQGDPLAYSRYRHEAISSETEFAISDGWSKVLSLPPGKYRYEIRPKKARVGNGHTKGRDQIVTGVIDWAAKRPNVYIR